MLPALDEISRRRKNLELSQKQLARLAGVSQSLIAKVEAGKINPSYLNAKAIFDTLESLETKMEIRARDILHNEVVGVNRGDSVARASTLMHETDYSQLPVFDEGRVVGSISEKTILDQTLKIGDLSELSRLPVEKVMDQAFPHVDEETPLPAISTLLRYSPAVLTTKKGKVTGIITKADLLKVVRT